MSRFFMKSGIFMTFPVEFVTCRRNCEWKDGVSALLLKQFCVISSGRFPLSYRR